MGCGGRDSSCAVCGGRDPSCGAAPAANDDCQSGDGEPLETCEAKQTFAVRFGRTADRLRGIATRFGLRPYRVFLVWSRWTGTEVGEGREVFARECEILPTPRVTSLDNVTFSAYGAGIVPEGSLRIDRVSSAYTRDFLTGHWVPAKGEDEIPEPYEFFYEIREDGRGDASPVREKYRILSQPMRRAGKIDWTFTLQRIGEDRNRDGSSRAGNG